MRGTPRLHKILCGELGIIPAYAGNTNSPMIPQEIHGDHPRVCGEHLRKACFRGGLTGSSPRMRGTPDRASNNTVRWWIIPAYAGNTEEVDHAAWCGWGSSPRMRGTHRTQVPRARHNGIIPAYAGNTRRSRFCRRYARDHPRVCGEHADILSGGLSGAGSSPRMRGTLEPRFDGYDGQGIIPAYAGNTMPVSRSTVTSRDHPRVCGEHVATQSPQTVILGSSPRMRGTQDSGQGRSDRKGIIPAYAGNTTRRERQGDRDGDHPRVCGEHVRSPYISEINVGSSPRMRGTQPIRDVFADIHGIIPAYAGNTLTASP